jgi:fructosamine-3-kinase
MTDGFFSRPPLLKVGLGKVAPDHARIDAVLSRAGVDRLAAVLPAIAGPPEPPARLHGDLWSGNVLTGPDGGPALIDPAVYGGHREVDLAMLALFGSVSPRLLAAYEEITPLADGWRDRIALWQLYPLLCHTVLFGGSYGASFERAIEHFV